MAGRRKNMQFLLDRGKEGQTGANRKTCDKHVDCCDGDMTPDKYKNMSYCLFDFLFAANVEAQRAS